MASRKEKDIAYLKKALKNHKGKWLTEEAVREYQKRAKAIFGAERECVRERRTLCVQLMQDYGITELEAINILNGYRANDYIAKYERIRTQTPLDIKTERDPEEKE
ncbi:MAG: hypothetical protein IJZ23_04395 [Roseburia sp.]|nr:hypothetical protein [Roseburia sp.]